jgi:hypothetical protein
VRTRDTELPLTLDPSTPRPLDPPAMTRCRGSIRQPWPQTRFYSTGRRYVTAKKLTHQHHDTAPAFDPSEPAVWPKGFAAMPAIAKWFTPSAGLNTAYLDQHSSTLVTLELTRTAPTPAAPATFDRFQAPLALLVAYMAAAPEPPSARMYLAQHSLADLPAPLQADLPTPALVSTLGRGDVYASSLWMGRPPTCTPLHRDPNPNLFVQLAGTKTVRLLRPDVGRAVYERARARAHMGRGGRANMRGEEMMVGGEMEALEDAIWGHGDSDGSDVAAGGVEAHLDPGDGLYIPLGWWHAVRGTGTGANASVRSSYSPDWKTNHLLT